MFKNYNKDANKTSIDVVLLPSLLTLKSFFLHRIQSSFLFVSIDGTLSFKSIRHACIKSRLVIKKK